jgi:hypothetical protein
MIIKVSICASLVALVLSAPVGATTSIPNPSNEAVEGYIILAQTDGMERRGDRRDDRQDCRGEEGAVGGDKRDCKQDARSGDSDDAKGGSDAPESD